MENSRVYYISDYQWGGKIITGHVIFVKQNRIFV